MKTINKNVIDKDQEYMCPACHGRWYGDELDDGECPQCVTDKKLRPVKRKQ